MILSNDNLQEIKDFISGYSKKYSLLERKIKNNILIRHTLDNFNIPHIPDAGDGEMWKFWKNNKEEDFMFTLVWMKIKSNGYMVEFIVGDTKITGANLHLIKESINLYHKSLN
jgi:hypothetical protein